MKTFLSLIILFSFLLNAEISIGQLGESTPSLKFYEQKNRHGLKISLGNLINENEDYIDVTYEYSRKDRRSYLFSAGIKSPFGSKLNIYLGGQEFLAIPEIANGIYFRLSTRYYSSSMKPRHFGMKANVFRGFYMEPEIVFGFYKRNEINYSFLNPLSSIISTTPEVLTQSVNYQGVMLNFGRQGVTGNFLLIDFSLSFGFANDNLDRVEPDERNNFELYNHRSIRKFNGGLSFATGVSLKVGGIF